MKKIFLIFGVLAILAACSSSDSTDDGTGSNNYNRTQLLTNWADNIIIPSYINYQSKVQTLVSNANAFVADPTEAKLQTARASWLEAYKAYQYVAQYNFGKAETIALNAKTNTYPTDKTGIESNVTAGGYDLSLLSQLDKQGFPALDYMINGLADNDAAIVSFYTTNTKAAKYKTYLTELTSGLKSNIDLVVTDWNTSYRNAYIANNGTTVNSSVNITTNNFVKTLEKNVRSGKLGIPAGVFSGGAKFPEKVEGFYKNNISKALYTTSIQASQDFFNGKHFNGTASGEGLKSYLDFLNTLRSGQKLSAIINAQFATIFTASTNLNDSFSNQINTDNSKMIAAYEALQQNIVYLKLDMMQALNITVDYVDSDGD